MPDTSFKLIDYILSGIGFVVALVTAIGVMWINLWKSAAINKKIELQEKTLQKYKDGVDKTVSTLANKVSDSENRINTIEKSVPRSVANLKEWANKEFTHVSEMRDKHKQLRSDIEEIKTILTDQRTQQIKNQSAKITLQDKIITNSELQISELKQKLLLAESSKN